MRYEGRRKFKTGSYEKLRLERASIKRSIEEILKEHPYMSLGCLIIAYPELPMKLLQKEKDPKEEPGRHGIKD